MSHRCQFCLPPNRDHLRPVFAARPQPRWSLPSVRCRTSTAKICQREGLKICQKECQRDCQKICQKEPQKTEGMPERTSEERRYARRMSETMSGEMPERMPEGMPGSMSESMSEDMPERMSDDMPERMSDSFQNIRRQKCQKICQKKDSPSTTHPNDIMFIVPQMDNGIFSMWHMKVEWWMMNWSSVLPCFAGRRGFGRLETSLVAATRRSWGSQVSGLASCSESRPCMCWEIDSAMASLGLNCFWAERSDGCVDISIRIRFLWSSFVERFVGRKSSWTYLFGSLVC